MSTGVSTPGRDGGLLGVVVIGRNEGERLRRCVGSLEGFRGPIVYVDSGSIDGSVGVARDAGWATIELDPGAPMSAARGRNEGFHHLMGRTPRPEFVQFIDGDCEIRDGWLAFAEEEMRARRDVVAMCGRVRERDPGASRYNRLCDMEWHAPAGDARHCGGVFVCRAEAFAEVGGFDPAVVAGEEPELCARLRAAGGRTVRIEREMALHDADMRRFSQWWRRASRGGLAYALNAQRLGERGAKRHVLSSLAWGAVVPAVLGASAALALWWPWCAWITAACALLLLAQTARIAWSRRRMGDSLGMAGLYAGFCLIGKTAQCAGVVRYLLDRLTGRRHRVVEHRAAPVSPARSR